MAKKAKKSKKSKRRKVGLICVSRKSVRALATQVRHLGQTLNKHLS